MTRTPRRRTAAATIAGAIAASSLALASGPAAADPTTGPTAATEAAPSPGTVLAARADDHYAAELYKSGARVQHALYATRDQDGKPAAASAALITPGGTPPAGGFPVVAIGHPTTGVAAECGPTRTKDLSGSLEPLVLPLLRAGNAVTITDYIGMGDPAEIGQAKHKYVFGGTENAQAVLDSVRALRTVFPRTVDERRTVVLGSSQGGQTAARAADIAATYAPDVPLAGAVLGSPALDLTPIAGLLSDPKTMTVMQLGIAPYLAQSLENATAGSHPYTALINDDVRTASRACLGGSGTVGLAAAAALNSATGSLRLADPAAGEWINQRLTAERGLTKRTTTPVFIVRGEEDPLILPEWTARAVESARAAGNTITDTTHKGGHATSDETAPMLAAVNSLFKMGEN